MSRPEPENQKQWFNSKAMDDLRKYNEFTITEKISGI